MSAPFATQWNQLVSLTQMENTVRRFTARYTEAQMTTAQIDYYLNLFMTLQLPQHFKNIKLDKPLVFNTIPNVDTYPFVYEQGLQQSPNTMAGAIYVPGGVQVRPPVYCQGYILRYMQDLTVFYNRWPELTVNVQVNSGNGVAEYTYSGNVSTTVPFLRAKQDIFGNVTEPAVIFSAYDNVGDTGFSYSATDVPIAGTNEGNIVDAEGNEIGTVNYVLGTYSITPIGAIPAGYPIYVSVIPYQPSRPTDVLFYNNQFVLRPVPMQVYQMQFQISMQPTQLIAADQAPELDEWYLFICAGAAKLIYSDFPDPEGMAYLMPIWQEQLQIAQRRTLKQLGTQRASTIFSEPIRPWSSWFLGDQYSGSIG